MNSSLSLMFKYNRRFFNTITQKRQFNLLLFGAPGVGKGTYSKFIEKDFDFISFSMGEYFRSVINVESD